jgi:hypothetical protein
VPHPGVTVGPDPVGTDPVTLAGGLATLVKQGRENEARLAAEIATPLPSDLRPEGTGIQISATV